MSMSVQRVAMIGAGTIGARWAAYFLSRGLEVTASARAPHGEVFAGRYVAEAWPTVERLGGLVPGARADRLRFERDPQRAAAGAEFVQESGLEREDIKIALFAELDAAAPPDTVIASSSSGLLISRIQSGCRHPERCVLGHPFNLPHLIPLVEAVGGQKTSPHARREDTRVLPPDRQTPDPYSQGGGRLKGWPRTQRSEEHTSELQSH